MIYSYVEPKDSVPKYTYWNIFDIQNKILLVIFQKFAIKNGHDIFNIEPKKEDCERQIINKS